MYLQSKRWGGDERIDSKNINEGSKTFCLSRPQREDEEPGLAEGSRVGVKKMERRRRSFFESIRSLQKRNEISIRRAKNGTKKDKEN